MKKLSEVKVVKKTKKGVKIFKVLKKTFSILVTLINIAIVAYGLYTSFVDKKADEV